MFYFSLLKDVIYEWYPQEHGQEHGFIEILQERQQKMIIMFLHV